MNCNNSYNVLLINHKGNATSISFFIFLCDIFFGLSAYDGCWFLVSILRFIYNCFNVLRLDCTTVVGSGEVWHLKTKVNHTDLDAHCRSN